MPKLGMPFFHPLIVPLSVSPSLSVKSVAFLAGPLEADSHSCSLPWADPESDTSPCGISLPQRQVKQNKPLEAIPGQLRSF